MKIRLLLVAVALGCITFLTLAQDCPEPEQMEVPFQHDANAVHYKVIGQVQMRVGQVFTCELRACDPDGDPMEFRLLSGPNDVVVDANTGYFGWQPAEPNVYYIDVEVVDVYGARDRGTIVISVGPPNRPPVFLGGCRR